MWTYDVDQGCIGHTHVHTRKSCDTGVGLVELRYVPVPRYLYYQYKVQYVYIGTCTTKYMDSTKSV
eukprot:SAG11_NODE_9302_length_924_cov_1.186667_1_plen_66_part_00